MKLAAHYNKASIIISVFVLLISGVIYYITINHIAKKQLDSNLAEEVEEVIEYVNINKQLPKPVDFDEDITTFAKTDKVNFDTQFFDTPYINTKEKEIEKGRAVSAIVKVNGVSYIVTIIESRENTEYLIQIISVITLLLTAILLATLVFTNRVVLRGLWRPFYYILEQVKWFNITDNNKVEFINAKVDEFKELSEAISKMALKATNDYNGLKIFTENASHEILTPLAVIISKLDMLIQDETLRADQLEQIMDIYGATNRLSRLNQSLLLLVKIDNDLLGDLDRLSVKEVINDKMRQFNELIQNKKIEVDLFLTDVEVEASRYLFDALINNLFSNAIRHNKSYGFIKIRLSDNELLFQNSGDPFPPCSGNYF